VINKGFGGSSAQDEKFARLVNAMLAGFFENRPVDELAEDIEVKYGVRVGSKAGVRAAKMIEAVISGDRDAYKILNEANKKHLLNMSIDAMTESGLVSGEDFSVVDDGVVLSGEVAQLFLQSTTPENLAKLVETGRVEVIEEH
jgi:hypothetical protein